MIDPRLLQTLFALFALLLQFTLVLHFAALRWWPRGQQRWGWLVYALSLPGLVLGGLCWMNGLPWYYGVATLLAAWAALGYTVDILRPIPWRAPLKLPVFIPYLVLYLAAQFAFWIPLWFVWFGFWLIYTGLYTLSTILNISSHVGGRKTYAHPPAG